MKRKVKKYKLGFWDYEILISVRYPAQRKKVNYFHKLQLNLARFTKNIKKEIAGLNSFLLKHLLLISLISLSVIIYYSLNLFLTHSYYTSSAKNLKNIVPVMAGLEKEKTIKNKVIKDKIVFNGPRNSKKIALTFDADMTPQMREDLTTGKVISYYDNNLIQVLKNTNTKATLFLAGMFIESYPVITKELAENSLFELANHSYSHPGFDGECYGLNPISDHQDYEEIKKTQDLLRKITGKNNQFFRFPGGCYSQNDLNETTRQEVVAVQWDSVAGDGFNYDLDNIISNVLTQTQNGSIIVMHMNGFPNEPQTANALPVIISDLKNRGYIFVTLSELLNIRTEENVDMRNLINPYFMNTK